MEKWAANASMQTIARLAMIAVAAIFMPAIGLAGWVGIRVVTTLDRIETKQTDQSDRLIALEVRYTGKMQLLDLTDLHLDSKLVETDNRLNKRIDQVSIWVQKNATELDNFKEKVYPLLPRQQR